MIKHIQEKEKRIHSFICFGLIAFIISLFILNASTAFADEPFTVLNPGDNGLIYIGDLTIPETVYNGTIGYGDDGIFIGSPIIWGDNVVTEVMELPSDSTILRLPDNRITIKSSDESINLQTFGTTDVAFVDGNYIIANPNGENWLYKNQIVDLEPTINKLFTNYKISQSIDRLDEYKVKLVFDELQEIDTQFKINITAYTVNWGDNLITQGDTNLFQSTHKYKKSGTYPIFISATDEQGYIYNISSNLSVIYEGDLDHFIFIVDENKEEIAATSAAGISGLVLVGFALTETGKYKFLAMLTLMIPMYTHVQKDDVLDQFVRGEIYGLVKSSPGVHYNEIMKKLDMKNGTLSYHLHMLEKMEMIKSRREGLKYRAFYPTEVKFPQEERYRLSDFQLEILKIIKDNEGIQQKEIAKKLSKKPQTINYNVKILQQAGLIKVRKKGRETGCYILKDFLDNQNKIP